MSERITIHTEGLPAFDMPERCKLVVVDGPDSGTVLEMSRETGPITVGTDPTCTLTLADGAVSRQHVRLELANLGVAVRDLDSLNGTYLGDSRIGNALLRPGMTLRIGSTHLRIQPRPTPVHIAPSQSRRFGDLVAESLEMREIFAVLERASQSTVPVLIEGETGTGKELAASGVHEASGRSGPFVALDCGALPGDLLESELFGHVAGAFTGAQSTRKGAFQRANGGTLFLDELQNMAPEAQVRLLRALESGRVRPVGSDTEVDVDVRIVAAGQRLAKRVEEGKLRADLYYRLSVVSIELPPLRDRPEDVGLIASKLLERRGLDFEPGGESLEFLRSHSWPGNVRELRNVLDRAIALSRDPESFEDLPIALNADLVSEPLAVRTDLAFTDAKQRVIETFERRYLADLIARCGGNVSEAARQANMDRKYLAELLDRHGLR